MTVAGELMTNQENQEDNRPDSGADEDVVANDSETLKLQITSHLIDLMRFTHQESASPEKVHELYEQAKHDVEGDTDEDSDETDEKQTG